MKFDFPCSSSYKVGDLVDYVQQSLEAINLEVDACSDVCFDFIRFNTFLPFLESLFLYYLL